MSTCRIVSVRKIPSETTEARPWEIEVSPVDDSGGRWRSTTPVRARATRAALALLAVRMGIRPKDPDELKRELKGRTLSITDGEHRYRYDPVGVLREYVLAEYDRLSRLRVKSLPAREEVRVERIDSDPDTAQSLNVTGIRKGVSRGKTHGTSRPKKPGKLTPEYMVGVITEGSWSRIALPVTSDLPDWLSRVKGLPSLNEDWWDRFGDILRSRSSGRIVCESAQLDLDDRCPAVYVYLRILGNDGRYWRLLYKFSNDCLERIHGWKTDVA